MLTSLTSQHRVPRQNCPVVPSEAVETKTIKGSRPSQRCSNHNSIFRCACSIIFFRLHSISASSRTPSPLLEQEHLPTGAGVNHDELRFRTLQKSRSPQAPPGSQQ